MKKYSDAIAEEESGSERKGYGFYGRNYSRTADISGYLNNFIIYNMKGNIRPIIHTPTYIREIRQDFIQKDYELRIAVFPFSNINLNQIFHIKEDISSEEGLFDIESPLGNQEELLIERCKQALLACRDYHVDIAVFPELLLNSNVQNSISDFAKNYYDPKGQLPWFTWLGTAWAERDNKCRVIDRYGNVIFEQKKYIPYEYKKGDKKITIRENLSHQSEWLVHFLDIPDYFRIATAICRDISSDYLTAFFKELYSDMVIIPAFSSSNRLTKRKVESLVLDRIITVVCNACSSRCKEFQIKYEVNEEMMGKTMPFCYLCLPAKAPGDNTADYYEVKYNEWCKDCDKYCSGRIFSVSFSKCIKKNGYYTAEVMYINS